MGNKIFVLCEGSSDEAFINALAKQRGLDNVEIKNLPSNTKLSYGIDGFGPRLVGMKLATDLENCKLVLVVADNDQSPDEQFRRVQRQIRQAGGYGIPDNPRQVAQSSEAF